MTHRDDSNGQDQNIQFPEEGGAAWREVLELLAEQGFEGLAEAMQTLLNEAMKLERSQVLGARPYERTARRQGYANGFNLTMFVPSGRYPKGEDVVQAIAADLGKVGIKAQVRPIESGTLFKLRDDRKIAPLFLFAWGSNLGDAGEIPLAILHSTSLNAVYSSPALDRLLNEAGTTIDAAARKQVLSKLQQQVKDEAPFLFLYTNEELYGVSTKLVGWNPRPDDRILMWDVTLAR